MRGRRLLMGFVGVLMMAQPVGAMPSRLSDEVRTRNPELTAMKARIGEARALVGPAATWQDPQFNVAVMDAPTLGGPQVSVSQMVPLLGQPRLMADMARLEVSMREAELDDRSLMLTAEAAEALVDLAYVRRTEDIVAASRNLTDRMGRVSEAKYAVGKGMQADVLRAHVAKTRLLEPSILLEAQRRAARAKLENVAPGFSPAPWPLPAGTALPQLRSLDALWGQAESASPMLRMRRFAVAHAELSVELASRERFPDLDVGVSAGRTMPGDMPFLGVMTGLRLPLWWESKQQQRLSAAEQRLTAERQTLEASRRRLRARIEEAHAQARAAESQLTLYRGGLAVQARQAFQAALAAYQVNQGDFLMMLDAQMALNDVQMAETMAIAERLKMEAMLDALTGREPLQEVRR